VPGTLRSPAAREALTLFADTLAQRYGPRVLLVFDCDRTRLYASQPALPNETYATLQALAIERNLTTLDLCPAFAQAFASAGLRTEVSLTDSHWNARGHDIAARAIAQTLTRR
jgi:hypothetical protein